MSRTAVNLFEQYGPEGALEARMWDLQEWLSKHGGDCQSKQRHLDEGTPDHIYWHFGYMCALRDILKQLRRHRRKSA